MPKFVVSDQARPYIDELREITSNGIGVWRPEAGSSLFALVCGGELTRDANPIAARARTIDSIERAVDGCQGERRQLLQALMALEPYDLTPAYTRHQIVAKIYGGQQATWDNFRREPQDRVLLDLLSRIEEAAVSGVQAVGVIAPNGFELVSYESDFILASGKNLQKRRIRAVQAGLRTWQMSTYVTGRGDQDAELLSQGTLIRHSEGSVQRAKLGTAFILEVDLQRELKKGEEVDIVILRTEAPEIASREPGDYEQRGLTPTQTTHRATMSAVFALDKLPKRAWHYENRASWLVPGWPEPDQILTIDASGRVSWSWDAPILNRSCGIAWEW